MNARLLLALFLIGCGGSSQVYFQETDQPLRGAGEPLAPPLQPPQRAKKRRGGPPMYSLHLENACPERVRLFLGQSREDPNGTEIVLGPGETASRNGFAPAWLFLLEAPEEGASEYAAEAGSQTVVVARSCADLERRE